MKLNKYSVIMLYSLILLGNHQGYAIPISTHQNESVSQKTLLGDPVLSGPIDLYHGLSNSNPSMSSNLRSLYIILNSGFLFPKGLDGLDLAQKIYQAVLPRLTDQASLTLDEATLASEYPSVWNRLLSEEAISPIRFELSDLHDNPVQVEITTPKLLRTGTNYFTTGKNWESYYTKFISLHFRLSDEALAELLKDTYGQSVLYQNGIVVTMPQPLPLKYLTSVIVDGEKLHSQVIAQLRSRLNKAGFGYVQIIEKYTGLKSEASVPDENPELNPDP